MDINSSSNKNKASLQSEKRNLIKFTFDRTSPPSPSASLKASIPTNYQRVNYRHLVHEHLQLLLKKMKERERDGVKRKGRTSTSPLLVIMHCLHSKKNPISGEKNKFSNLEPENNTNKSKKKVSSLINTRTKSKMVVRG